MFWKCIIKYSNHLNENGIKNEILSENLGYITSSVYLILTRNYIDVVIEPNKQLLYHTPHLAEF